jgi:hypothetical protein
VLRQLGEKKKMHDDDLDAEDIRTVVRALNYYYNTMTDQRVLSETWRKVNRLWADHARRVVPPILEAALKKQMAARIEESMETLESE